jgi:hypothetical protein
VVDLAADAVALVADLAAQAEAPAQDSKPMKLLPALCFSMALLAVSGASRYRAVSRDVRVGEVRRTLAAQAARVNTAIQSGQCTDFHQIELELQRIRHESRNQIAWIRLRDETGAVRFHAGIKAPATFPVERAKSQLARQIPVFSILPTQKGEVVLEVFPIRLPASPQRASIRMAASSGGGIGLVEIAAPINSQVPVRRAMLPNFL